MSGRGAWPVSGDGGTFKYKSNQPGPYYFLGSGEKSETPNERAVHGAVKAYQRAVNKRIRSGITVDGIFGEETAAAIFRYQELKPVPNTTPWGGIGPATSRALLLPALKYEVRITARDDAITWQIVCGLAQQESNWDAGAVGYADENDLGLVQINGTAHPDLTEEDRLKPRVAVRFAVDYLINSYKNFGQIDDAIISYNLGGGGTRSWIAAGRPDLYTPSGSTTERNIREYINTVKNSC